MKVTVIQCERCGGTHEDLEFAPLTNHDPESHWVFWAMCPALNQPLMLNNQMPLTFAPKETPVTDFLEDTPVDVEVLGPEEPRPKPKLPPKPFYEDSDPTHFFDR